MIYNSDTRFLYRVVIETINDFDDFKQMFYDYIGEKTFT
jgi:hypothetical protein